MKTHVIRYQHLKSFDDIGWKPRLDPLTFELGSKCHICGERITKESLMSRYCHYICKDCSNLRNDITKEGTWISMLDKHNNLLKKPKIRKIKNLTDSHLFAIVQYYNKRESIPPLQILVEIYYRKEYPTSRIKYKCKILNWMYILKQIF